MKNRTHILQNLISDEHQDAMFYSGIIAVKEIGNKFCLIASDAEIVYNNKQYIGKQITELAAFYVICDVDIQHEVDTYVDGFFYIAELNADTLQIQSMEEVDDSRIFNTYDEAVQAFTNFIE